MSNRRSAGKSTSTVVKLCSSPAAGAMVLGVGAPVWHVDSPDFLIIKIQDAAIVDDIGDLERSVCVGRICTGIEGSPEIAHATSIAGVINVRRGRRQPIETIRNMSIKPSPANHPGTGD